MRRAMIGLAVLATLTACTRADAPAATTAAPVKLRVALSLHPSWGPLMIAQEEGFFKAEGLDVEFVTTMRPEESLAALVTGDLDVLPGPIHAGFLSAIAQGAKVRLVAGQGRARARRVHLLRDRAASRARALEGDADQDACAPARMG